MSSNDEKPQEILIIRRGGGDDGMTAKGGAWKIAYADFVTAMMAFFLVMWLINSANEVTKARVASYFNPIKMTDASPAPKGLKEKTEAQVQSNRTSIEVDGGAKQVDENAKVLTVSGVGIDDNKLLMNPYRALEELLKMSDQEAAIGKAEQESSQIGDPFNPRSFELYEEDDAGEKDQKKLALDTASEKKSQSKSQKLVLPETEKEVSEPSDKSVAKSKEAAKDKLSDTENAKDQSSAEVSQGPNKDTTSAKTSTAEQVQLVQELKESIEKKIEEFKGEIDINVQVKATDEGLLVVLEDGNGRSMFTIGSALPNPALIEIVGNIGKLLASTEGGVIIRGHTDGRQFRNRKYDNWQLSTDRAHMASYMLIRGGLSEERISRIEGYGASDPVKPGEFMLDANRRVEFLLKR